MLYSAVNTLKKLLINNELKDFDPVKEAFKAFFFLLVFAAQYTCVQPCAQNQMYCPLSLYILIHICISIYYKHAHTCICISICICIYICIYRLCVCVYIYTHVHVYIYIVCVCVFVNTCMLHYIIFLSQR